jgi:hypothetical protein
MNATQPMMFRIEVEHARSGLTLCFLGQGANALAAVDDGVKNLNASFRPRDGVTREPGKVSAHDAQGRPLVMTLAEFDARCVKATADHEAKGQRTTKPLVAPAVSTAGEELEFG